MIQIKLIIFFKDDLKTNLNNPNINEINKNQQKNI